MNFPERCYCGSPDCKRCFPLTWDEPPPELCDNCDYSDDCSTAGSPTKKCQKCQDLESFIERHQEANWEEEYKW